MSGPRPARPTIETALAAALRAPDPAAALRAAAADPALPARARRALAGADPDGVRIAALLVLKLRFERLLRGDAAATRWFDTDPAGFTEAFRRYHAEVPSPSLFPSAEAEAWRKWRG